jgi:citrate lyase subunit beta/citryl-CoA lyase
VVSLCFGGARGGDLHADLGSGWSIDGPELLHARQQVLLAARAAGVAWPLDGVFSDVRDPEAFRRDTELSRRLGYRGRPVIHPSQAPIANEAYAPTPDEVDAARRVVQAVEAAAGQGRGTATVDGRMVDSAMARQARALLAHAASLARKP